MGCSVKGLHTYLHIKFVLKICNKRDFWKYIDGENNLEKEDLIQLT
jgi:hypothetical protein